MPLESKLCDDHDSEYDQAAILDGWIDGPAMFMWIQNCSITYNSIFSFLNEQKKIVGV